MIKTRNKKELEFVVASGALGWDGNGWPWEKPLVKLGAIDPSLFTITTKTLTRFINRGKWWAVKPVRGGVWNNMGLPNKGIDWWLNTYCYTTEDDLWRKALPYKTLVSIAPYSLADLHYIVKRGMNGDLEGDPNFVGYELNVSCPNTQPMKFETIKSMIKALGDGTGHIYTTVLKLNYQQAFYSEGFTDEQLKELLPYCDAISLNSAPLAYGKGAYSGQVAQQYNWATAEHLQNLGFKVIWPSLWEYGDIQKCFDKGAGAVSFGAVHLLRPWAPTQWIRRYKST
jgi:hypothetical protein